MSSVYGGSSTSDRLGCTFTARASVSDQFLSNGFLFIFLRPMSRKTVRLVGPEDHDVTLSYACWGSSTSLCRNEAVKGWLWTWKAGVHQL